MSCGLNTMIQYNFMVSLLTVVHHGYIPLLRPYYSQLNNWSRSDLDSPYLQCAKCTSWQSVYYTSLLCSTCHLHIVQKALHSDLIDTHLYYDTIDAFHPMQSIYNCLKCNTHLSNILCICCARQAAYKLIRQ